jgi:hypothetical protein
MQACFSVPPGGKFCLDIIFARQYREIEQVAGVAKIEICFGLRRIFREGGRKRDEVTQDICGSFGFVHDVVCGERIGD